MKQNLSQYTVRLVLRNLLTAHQYARVLAATQSSSDILSACQPLRLVTEEEYREAEALALAESIDVVTALSQLGYMTWIQSWDAHNVDQQEMLARMVPAESWVPTETVLLTAPLFTDEQFESMLSRVGWRGLVNKVMRPATTVFRRGRRSCRNLTGKLSAVVWRVRWTVYYSDAGYNVRRLISKVKRTA